MKKFLLTLLVAVVTSFGMSAQTECVDKKCVKSECARTECVGKECAKSDCTAQCGECVKNNCKDCKECSCDRSKCARTDCNKQKDCVATGCKSDSVKVNCTRKNECCGKGTGKCEKEGKHCKKGERK